MTEHEGEDPAGGLPRWFLDRVEREVAAGAATAAGDTRPVKPIPPGRPAPPIAISADAVQSLAAAALASAYAPAGQAPPAQVIWEDGGDEVLVRSRPDEGRGVSGARARRTDPGDRRAGPGQILVPFAVGSPANPAGMLAMTEERPRGPAPLVDRWGEAAIAAAWRALLDLAHGIALQSGFDVDGSRLIPGAIAIDGQTLTVTPQARHPDDRVVGR